MRKKILLITFLIILNAANAFALSVRVSVTNATKGGKLFNYPFELLAVEPDKYGGIRVLKTYEFRTDLSGIFQGEMDASAGKAIMGKINYRGVLYYSPLLHIKKEQDYYTLDFNVYEITDKADSVEISGRSITIAPYDDKTVIVYDSIIVENNSMFTYVGKYNEKLKTNQTLFIPLPAGYSLMKVQGIDQREIHPLSGGMVSQSEILPGESSIFLKYFVKSDIGVFDLSLYGEDNSPPVKSISLFFQNKEKWKAESSDLQHRGEREFKGSAPGIFNVWEGRELRRINFIVSAPSHQAFFNLWQASVLIALVMSVSGLFIMKGRIYRWNMRREKTRLERILTRLKVEADAEDLRGYYKSFLKVLEDRSREIEDRPGS
ncbi:hypothetical protein BMS3Abin10_00619 [bacterium BMS3Abin10]|nr:hypothetical protein BMS3Abin10_00619 [bacterium BMS3Abin10]GBE39733.1 hypothetical protein BMS3Bbin08_02364 [bacterium BMS3Bbin08]HDH50194.1 hypothetical protein [Nitrospirota bacterium]